MLKKKVSLGALQWLSKQEVICFYVASVATSLPLYQFSF